jgi:hypothetical protein
MEGDTVVVKEPPRQFSPKRPLIPALMAIAILVALTDHSKGASATGQCLFNNPSPDRSTLSIPTGQSSLPSLKCQTPFPDTVFDPAATQFNASLSYGAMSLIAPTIFGDFQSPTQVSYPSFTWGGPVMSANVGSDPAASIMLSNVLEPDLLTNIPAIMADAFGFGPGVPDPSGAPIAATPQSGTLSVSINDHAEASPITGGRGTEVSCGTEVPNELQIGGEFWNAQAASPPPAQFAKGVFVGGELGDPLGDLGPTGNPTNLPRPGQAGAWCSPRYTPFSVSGPLESDALWILFSILLASVLVAWLSRSHRLPAA